MADGVEVRIVCCPRCDKLLPEPQGLSLYQCGGCGTVLRAKKKVPVNDDFVDNLYDKKDLGSCEKFECLSEIGGSSVSCASDSEWDNPIMESSRKERVIRSRRTYLSHSTIGTDDKEDFNDYEMKSEKETKGVWSMQRTVEKEVGLVDSRGQFSEQRIDNWVRRYNLEKDTSSYDSDSLSIAPTVRSRANFEHQRVDRDAFTGYPGNSMAVSDRQRVPNFVYTSERPSSSNSDLFYGQHGAIGNYEDPMMVNTVEGMNPNRADLLRRLDELKMQILESCDVGDKPRVVADRAPIDPYYGRAAYNVAVQSSTQNSQPIGNRTIPLTGHHLRNSEDFLYSPRNLVKDVPLYEDPYEQKMTRKAHYLPTHQYPQQLPREDYPESFMDFKQDPLPSRAQDAYFHHPSCSCLQCSRKSRQGPLQSTNPPISNMRNTKDTIKSSLYRNENQVTIGLKSSNPQSVGHFPSQDMHPHSLQPSELDSDINGFALAQPRKAAELRRNGKFCDAIAGGAPFIVCSSCLELLKLPKKLYKLEKDWKKLQCGACSVVITVKVENKRFIINIPAETEVNEVSPDDGSAIRLCANATNSCLENSDNSSEKLTDTKHIKPSENHDTNSGEFKEQELTTSSISSKKENNPAGNCALKGFSISAEVPSENVPSPTNSHSPPEEHSNRPSEHEISNCSNGSKIEQNSVIDVSGATVVDDFFDDYSNTQVSRDSVEISKCTKGSEIKQNSVMDVSGATVVDDFFDDYSNTQVSRDSVEISKCTKGSEIKQNSVMDVSGATVVDEFFDDYSNTRVSRDSEQIIKRTKGSEIEKNSAIDVSGATVVDDFFDDYSNTQVSQESVEIRKEEEEDQNKIGKGPEPFFVGLNENNLRDFSRSSEIVDSGKAAVSVNGQPLPAHVVKKAEKLAGPILPGDYWYDYQAGFWGVMGHSCLGIIPPFIEEFTYQMPRNCAAGNTGIYVNGRELHKMDLDLLSNRGLPITKDKFYRVDISGRVVDEESGKALYHLGKLAPTIEKVKHGFGMKVPRSLK